MRSSMPNEQFDELLNRIPKIAEAVNKFKSEAIQLEADSSFQRDSCELLKAG